MLHWYTESSDNLVVLLLSCGEWVVFGGLGGDLTVLVELVSSTETAVHPGGDVRRCMLQVLLSFGNTLVMTSASLALAKDEDTFLRVGNHDVFSGGGFL